MWSGYVLFEFNLSSSNKKVYEPVEINRINRVLLQFVCVIYIFFKNCLIMWPYVELIADVWCGLEE